MKNIRPQRNEGNRKSFNVLGDNELEQLGSLLKKIFPTYSNSTMGRWNVSNRKRTVMYPVRF
ncbi:MAG TPA: hypothetical protein VK142_05675 [Bacillota bacterium]|nr:hypothetical protein [Bacillota bacterium]